jgi:hypothetical protein
MQRLLKTAIIYTWFYHDNARLSIVFNNPVHMRRKHHHNAVAKRRTTLISAGTAGSQWDDPAALGELPAEAGGFADVVFVLRINNYCRDDVENTSISGKIAACVGTGHHFAGQVFL